MSFRGRQRHMSQAGTPTEKTSPNCTPHGAKRRAPACFRKEDRLTMRGARLQPYFTAPKVNRGLWTRPPKDSVY
jgi:hypothetical protein